MIKNLYLCLKNMQKHFSNELLGDDSLSNYTKFMKKNNKYKKKKNYFYILGLMMVKNIYKDHPPPTNDIAPKLLGVDEP